MLGTLQCTWRNPAAAERARARASAINSSRPWIAHRLHRSEPPTGTARLWRNDSRVQPSSAEAVVRGGGRPPGRQLRLSRRGGSVLDKAVTMTQRPYKA